jgi:hypothetical protein
LASRIRLAGLQKIMKCLLLMVLVLVSPNAASAQDMALQARLVNEKFTLENASEEQLTASTGTLSLCRPRSMRRISGSN